MSGAQSISTRRAYGVERVCRVWHRARLERVCAAAGDTVPCAVSSPRADRRRPGRRPGGPHSPSARSLAVSWRGVPESLGKAAVRRDPHLEGAGAPVDARARPPGPAARGPRARAEGARRDHHHRGARRDVGHGHDGHRDGRRGGGLRLRGRRSLRDRGHRSPCSQEREPLRGPGADSPGASGNASGVSAKAWPAGFVSGTTTGRTTWPTISNRRSRSSASNAPRASCGSPKATALRSASSAR